MTDWPFGDLPESGFGVILADPPWRFETRSARNQNKAAPYATMSRAELMRLPVWRLAAPNCALAMWATQAQLHEAVDLVKSWGFDYKSAAAWAKLSKLSDINSADPKLAMGTGYWPRSCAEFILFGAIGAPRIRARGERNLIIAPVREHSRKPPHLHEMLERMFPGTRKLELFARAPREGWRVWGNETGKFMESDRESRNVRQ